MEMFSQGFIWLLERSGLNCMAKSGSCPLRDDTGLDLLRHFSFDVVQLIVVQEKDGVSSTTWDDLAEHDVRGHTSIRSISPYIQRSPNS
jgi:hypothetical protein